MEKYKDAHMPGGLALPVMSNQKMNDALKILFKQAGLDKPITQWTGHSSLAAMKPYMAIADKEKKNAMKKFDEV